MSGWRGLLRCPGCGGVLAGDDPLRCAGCGTAYPARDGIPVLLPPPAGDPVAGRIAGYYDANAEGYERSHGIGWPGGDWSIARYYVPFIAPALGPEATVLEIGAGTGKVTRHLVPLARTVLASDIAPGMLAWGRARNGLRDAVVADAHRLPFADGAFDAVVAMNALSYCVDKDRALAEVRRVLRPGGRLILIDMNYLLFVPYLLLGLKEWRKARLWTRQLLQSTPWGWRRRLRAAGFEMLRGTEMNFVPHRFTRTVVRFVLAPLDAVLSRVPLLRRCAMRIAIDARRT